MKQKSVQQDIWSMDHPLISKGWRRPRLILSMKSKVKEIGGESNESYTYMFNILIYIFTCRIIMLDIRMIYTHRNIYSYII